MKTSQETGTLLRDTHSNSDFHLRDVYGYALKPDFTLVSTGAGSNGEISPFYVKAIIEFKEPSAPLGPSEKAQMSIYLSSVLLATPKRQKIWGMLTNGKQIVFVQASQPELHSQGRLLRSLDRANSIRFRYYTSDSLQTTMGQENIAQFLQASNDFFGISIPCVLSRLRSKVAATFAV